MHNYDEISAKVAEQLLQIKAVKLSPTKPFKWASGWNSPIYCDNRVALSYPQVRTYLRQKFATYISEEYSSADCIAGVATGGIAIGALVAEELGLPFVYVRAKAKAHGTQNLIDGELTPGWKTVVIEDLISTGKSSLNAVEALKEANAKVLGMTAIFTYGFSVAEKNFEKAACPLYTLTDYHKLLEVAQEHGYLNSEYFETLHEWREAPEKWNK
ncbi:MAG: orotate phosphoribosyltransferase [Sphingobacteriales bacterium]|jgi:orotate phosphoribosyltransferase